MPRRALGLLLVAILAAGSVAGAQVSVEDALGFEVAGVWRSAPDLTDVFDESLLWSTRTLPFEELAGGVTLDSEHVKAGASSGRWADHPRYPTIHCRQVPRDWSGFNTLALWVFSQEATGERITIGVKSDSEATVWADYYLRDFVVDWTGWRRLVFALSSFREYEQPAGWGKVDAVCFFAMIFDRRPNPYTVLYLDDLRLESRETVPPDVEPAPPTPGPQGQIPSFDPGILNHRWPEIRPEAQTQAPFQYQPYFLAERAISGYYPRFQPGFVSFSPQGRPFVQYASHIIQALDSEGRWQVRDLFPDVIEPYCKGTLGFSEIALTNAGQGGETAIRFDADGDAYFLCWVSDPTGDWKTRKALLLHSQDDMRTWNVYLLPWYMARFEKFVGHNTDCLRRPPVILMSRYHAPTSIHVTLPEKQADGTLLIPDPVKIADDAIPFMPHSGQANQAITVGDRVFIVYGKLEVLPGRTQEDGVPNYAVAWDPKTRELSDPVLMGFGGINAKDDHNWPALGIDSTGTLHALINGHHNPFVYVRAAQAGSIAGWSEPEKVGVATSYAGLVIDRQDTLYAVTRNSDPGYYFRLSLHRKKAGQDWEAPRHLTIPFKPYYEVWFHTLVIDPATDRLFLCYHSQSPSICLFHDEYLAYIYRWPDREKRFMSAKDAAVPTGTYLVTPRKYEFYGPPASEMTILVSDDHGDSWHLATSEDFVSAEG